MLHILASPPPPAPFCCECWSPFPHVSIRRPFFLDLRNIRRDITNGRSGVPLYLDLTVLGDCNAKGFGCTPKKDALVDAWHADSRGVYRCVGGGETGSDRRCPAAGCRAGVGWPSFHWHGGTEGSSARPLCVRVSRR